MNFFPIIKAGILIAAFTFSGCIQTDPASSTQAPTKQSDNFMEPSAALVKVSQPTNIRSIAIIVNFTDLQANRTEAQYSAMLNQSSGYNTDGVNGSVNEYFNKQSNGNVNITFEVVSVTLPRPHTFYINDWTRNPPWDGHQVMVQEVIAAVKSKYPAGFTGLSLHPSGTNLWNMNFLVAWDGSGGVNFGLALPNVGIKSDGIVRPVNTVCLTYFSTTSPPNITTITHELGHNIMEWTDYYYYLPDSTSMNLGHYCLMGSGGNDFSPMPINPGLRFQQGWISNVIEVSKTTRTTYNVTANSTRTVYKYTNPKDPQEYYLIEALRHGDYYVAVDGDGITTDEGLAIWYVHENYSANWPFLRVKLVQADGRDDMSPPVPESHNGPWLRGDLTDLFDNTYNKFNEALYPIHGWKDGSPVNLRIENISAPGPTMNFTVVPPTEGAIQIPGRIEAEAYRLGGRNVGYKDLTNGNTGNIFRKTEDVDLQASTDVGGGYNVGWTQAGEWIRYELNVITAGTYTFTARVASGATGTKVFKALVDGNPIGSFTFADASGWQVWKNLTLSNVNLTSGHHILTLEMGSSNINLNYLDATLQSGQISIPGRIQAEDYRVGGEGVGYHDLTTGNSGNKYRTDNVDIQSTTDVGGGFNVGWTQATEWLDYNINVTSSGAYKLTGRLASSVTGTKSIAVSVDGVQVTVFSTTDATGAQSWKNVFRSNINLSAGTHTLRLTFNSSNINVNYIDIQPMP